MNLVIIEKKGYNTSVKFWEYLYYQLPSLEVFPQLTQLRIENRFLNLN